MYYEPGERPPSARPKRHRRTKEEIDAAENDGEPEPVDMLGTPVGRTQLSRDAALDLLFGVQAALLVIVGQTEAGSVEHEIASDWWTRIAEARHGSTPA